MTSPLGPFATKVDSDVWDYILSFIRDDIQSLKSCGLVWSEWLPSVYRYLHQRFRLSASCDKHRVGKGSSMMDATTPIPVRIMTYVRELTLEFECWCHGSAIPWWSAHLPSVRCQRLQIVRIRWTNWVSLPEETRLQLASFLGAHSFQILSLTQCSFPSSLSLKDDLRCESIAELRLDGVEFRSTWLGAEDTELDRKNSWVPEPDNLKVLKICLWSSDAASATVQWVLHSLGHPDLQSLELYWNVYEHGISLLAPLLSSFKSLHPLEFMHSSYTEKLLGELYIIPSLKTLHICGCYKVPSFNGFNPPPGLREIHINLILQNRNARSDFVSKRSASLNEEINNTTAFSSITKVLFRLAVLNEAEWLHINDISKTNLSLPGIVEITPNISFGSKGSGLYAASPTYVFSRQVDD